MAVNWYLAEVTTSLGGMARGCCMLVDWVIRCRQLGHLGERVVLLGNQVWGAAVPSRECPGETGQPEREGKGGAAPVEVPEGARA